jgi:peptide/nickel transport system substrate-binding protein
MAAQRTARGGTWAGSAVLCLSLVLARGTWAQAGAALPAAGPGPCPADRYLPGLDGEEAPAPRRGGRVIVHVANMPASLNYMIDNNATCRRMLDELHENLIEPDWETWEYRGVLAERWTVEDTLVLRPGRGPAGAQGMVYGEIEKTPQGWRVTPRSPRGRTEVKPFVVAYDDVERIERETVFTFHLRPGVRWHDQHLFDVDDVLFSYSCYMNPGVHCDAKRFQFEQIARIERVDEMTVRFFFERQYFRSMATFENLTILPAHRYDLSDPDNPDHVAGASPEQQARWVNEHACNRNWLGLGPYRLTEWSSQFVEAQRFDDYFDRTNAGWVDTIRWRYVPPKDEVMMQALLEGELDFLDRLSTTDYFGETTQSKAFTSRFYKGNYYTPRMSYTVWNTRKPKFADPSVRRALGMCFDWDEFIASYYKGLAFRVTGMQYYSGPNYERGITPLPFDPAGAEQLLESAGWYDRDGDGLVDKDGAPFSFEYLVLAGDPVSEIMAQRFQEGLARVGVRMEILPRDWPSLFARIEERDFECATLAIILDTENDVEQAWHSRWADVVDSSNYSGLKDEQVDRLIEAIQVEIDPAARVPLHHRLQARVYELQPYMFGVYVPIKFAMSRRVRNFQIFALDPGYSIRRWFVVGE